MAYSIGAISLEFYRYAKQTQQYKDEVSAGKQADATPEQRQLAEGKDEAESTPDALSGYKVEASHPRVILIDSIDLRGRILPMGLNPDKSVQAPINIFDAGWYTGSAKPGEKGAAVIDGHASGPSRKGLFAYVETLANGDRLKIERGDGSLLEYEVVGKKEYDYKNVDMAEVLRVHEGDEGANLITCTGAWVDSEKTFDKRVVVFTRRVS